MEETIVEDKPYDNTVLIWSLIVETSSQLLVALYQELAWWRVVSQDMTFQKSAAWVRQNQSMLIAGSRETMEISRVPYNWNITRAVQLKYHSIASLRLKSRDKPSDG
jgi:hypothetical protein